MKYLLLSLCAFSYLISAGQSVDPYSPDTLAPQPRHGMHLVFSEEFNNEGKPNPANWGFETGFKRNEEMQWYQSDNANCTAGRLLIEGKKANFPNPNYVAGSSDWRTNRKTVNYTSSCIITKDKKSWMYGRFEIRARIDTSLGAWPAIWTLGVKQEWPSCGEIDLMEFYRVSGAPTVLANAAWGTAVRWTPKWDSFKKPLASLLATDANWPTKYHIWRMDWTPDSIRLYVDDVLFNYTLLSQTINSDGSNPFRQPHYMLLNLAMGSSGGDLTHSTFPIKYEVDYVRIYQKDSLTSANQPTLYSPLCPALSMLNQSRLLNFRYDNDLSKLNVSVFDSRGANLLNHDYASIESGRMYSIDLKDIPTGLIFVRFDCDTTKTYKMMLTE